MKRKWMAAALAGALLLTGCGKQEEAPREVTAPLLTEVPETVPAETAPMETQAATEAAVIETTEVTEATLAPVETEAPETVPAETEPEKVLGKVIKVESLNVR